MSFDDKIYRWSKAHVFYNMFTHEPDDDVSMDVKREYEWRMKALKETPNGNLLI